MKGYMSYLDRIFVNTGYTLDELIREGVMDGRVIDHSAQGGCGCIDVSGVGINVEGLHYRCACEHPIRWAYAVNMRGETFYFGSTCIKHWMIECPDCKMIGKFEGYHVNTIDNWYRCEHCHEAFLRLRRDTKKKELERKKKELEMEQSELERKWEEQYWESYRRSMKEITHQKKWMDYNETIKGYHLKRETRLDKERDELVARVEREYDKYIQENQRKCVDCKSGMGEAPLWKVRCMSCYKKTNLKK
jgi:hypothetical protein